MATTIKLKTGSGSDPSASDLIVGEIAIRTDSGKLFTKKDNGSVAEISGGGGIDDGDKGDITVSNGGDTFTIDNGVVTSAKIADGTIVNADINASAAIDGSKISPAFTSDITGTGDLTLTSTDTGSSASPIIELYRNSASPADADYLGQFKFTGESDDGSKEVYAKMTAKIDDASSGTEDGLIEFALRKAGSNNIGARLTSTDLKLINGTGLEVAGSITSSGNLTISNTHPQIFFTDTDNNSDFKIQNLNGVFGVRDETNTATRFSIASNGTVDVAGNLDVGAGVDVTGNITVSGTVDGRDVATDGSKLDGIEAGATADQSNSEIKTAYEANSNTNAFTDALLSKLNGIEASATADQTAAEIKTLLNSNGIVNAQIDASAAIAGTKISPDFGTQDIRTGGDIFIDVRGKSFKTSDWNIFNTTSGNGLSISGGNSSSVKIAISSGGNVDVAGNITVGGTVDGVDIAARDTLFGGLTSSSGVLSNGVTATTQGASDNTTKVATTAYVTTAVSNLINGAPSALDTLNELAAAMNDDAAFSTTVTNSLATKMPLAGGEFTGNVTFSGSQTVDGRDLSVDGAKLDTIESNATADQTASEILTLIKTVDGSGSGLDADTLDGISSASFLRSDAADTASANITINGAEVGAWSGGTAYKGLFHTSHDNSEYMIINNDGHTFISATAGSNVYIRAGGNSSSNQLIVTTSGATIGGNSVLTSASSLNASNLGSGTIPAARVPTLNQNTTGSAATLTTARTIAGTSFDGSANIDISYANLTNKLSVGDGGLTQNNFTNALKSKLDGIAASATNVTNNNQLTNGAGYITSADGGNAATLDGIDSTSFVRSDADDTLNGQYTISDSANEKLVLAGSSNPHIRFQEGTTNKAYIQWNSDGYINLVNTESNEAVRIQSGASGLKFVEGGNVRNVYHTGNLSEGDGGLTTNNFTDADHNKLDGIESGATADQTASEILTLIKTVDGSGSGLDADSVDGIAGSSLLRSDAADTASGDITFTGGAGAATIGANSDIRFTTGNWTGEATKIQKHGNYLYLQGGSDGFVFRHSDGTNRWILDSSGTWRPSIDGAVDLGSTSQRVGEGHFLDLASRHLKADNGIVQTKQTIAFSYSLTANYNAMSVDPTVNSGVTVTVPSGATWAIV